jgi:hypothetical protein
MEHSRLAWRDILKVNSLALLLPPLPDAEKEELREDIKAHGLQVPPVWRKTKEGPEIIDGLHRLDALEALGYSITVDRIGNLSIRTPDNEPIRFPLRPAKGNPADLVISLNLRRRQIASREQARAFAKELLKKHPERSDRSVAHDAGLAPTTAGKIRREIEAEGVQLSKMDSSPAPVAEEAIKRERVAGGSFAELAQTHGVTKEQVREICRERPPEAAPVPVEPRSTPKRRGRDGRLRVVPPGTRKPKRQPHEMASFAEYLAKTDGETLRNGLEAFVRLLKDHRGKFQALPKSSLAAIVRGMMLAFGLSLDEVAPISAVSVNEVRN